MAADTVCPFAFAPVILECSLSKFCTFQGRVPLSVFMSDGCEESRLSAEAEPDCAPAGIDASPYSGEQTTGMPGKHFALRAVSDALRRWYAKHVPRFAQLKRSRPAIKKRYECPKRGSTDIVEPYDMGGLFHCRKCRHFSFRMLYRYPRSYYFALALCVALVFSALLLAQILPIRQNHVLVDADRRTEQFTGEPSSPAGELSSLTGELSSLTGEPEIALERCATCVTYSQPFYQYTCPDGFILGWSEPSVSQALMENLCAHYGHGK